MVSAFAHSVHSSESVLIRYDAAEDDCSLSLSMNKDNIKTLFIRATSRFLQGQLQEARQGKDVWLFLSLCYKSMSPYSRTTLSRSLICSREIT